MCGNLPTDRPGSVTSSWQHTTYLDGDGGKDYLEMICKTMGDEVDNEDGCSDSDEDDVLEISEDEDEGSASKKMKMASKAHKPRPYKR